MLLRVLLINGSPRSEHTCPGEMSKTWRLLMAARNIPTAKPGTECEILDLSRIASEYGRPAGEVALLDRYIGYYQPYGASHESLDADEALFKEVGNAAHALHDAVTRYRQGELSPGAELPDPRPK